jgi:perosamine synthetase
VSNFVPVNEPLLCGNEKEYLGQCIDTGWISSEGPFVNRFEDDVARRVGRKYAIAVANGTGAIDIAIKALDLQAGDEVIVPAFTIISTIQQLLRSGIKPIFIDCCIDTWNMDADLIENKITSKTKAIMLVHIYGLTPDCDKVLAIANKFGLRVIEDAAEAIGLITSNKPCGGIGDISTFSFYANKHITTGEGGMILTDDATLAERCRDLRSLCFGTRERFLHTDLGWNYRMTNLQAAVGCAQLEYLDDTVQKKRLIGNKYMSSLENIDELTLPIKETNYCDNIYWIFGLLATCDAQKREITEYLRRHKIGSRPFFFPLNLQPVLSKFGIDIVNNCKNAKDIFDRGFYIPSGTALTEPDQLKVIQTLKSFFTK